MGCVPPKDRDGGHACDQESWLQNITLQGIRVDVFKVLVGVVNQVYNIMVMNYFT